MRMLLTMIVAAMLFAPMKVVAEEPGYRVLAEKQIGPQQRLRVLRGPDLPAAELAAVPFYGAQSRHAGAFFPLRISVTTTNGREAVVFDTLMASSVTYPMGDPERYSGFVVLALDADQNGVIMVAAWLANIYAVMIDPQRSYTFHPLQNHATSVRISVDKWPDLSRASLAKSPDGRWIITTSSSDLGYVYEQTEDRKSVRLVHTTFRGKILGEAKGDVVDPLNAAGKPKAR